MNKKSLGRGLSSLLSDNNIEFNVSHENHSDEKGNTVERKGSLSLIPIEKIIPNKNQPRKTFGEEELNDLVLSIKSKGLLQPIIVREKGEFYEIVAGERRWRASQLAQIHEIPALIKELSEAEVLEIAIIENIQRANLNPYEEALGYKELLETYNYTHEELANNLGKSRTYISNSTRLLNLPNGVLEYLRDGALTIGHARALINVKTALEIAQTVVRKGLSVRETESIVRKISNSHTKESVNKKERDPDTEILERELSAELGFPVSILHTRNEQKGRMVLNYKTLDDLDRVINIIMKKNLN